MPITTIGFNGTVNEAGMARLLALAGSDNVVTSRSAFAATQINGQRAIRLAASATDWAYSPGTASNNTTAIDVQVPGPAAGSGQWFLIALRRDWDKDTTEPVVLKGPTTSTTPLAVPTSFPSDYESRLGIVDDQELYWAWSNTTNLAIMLVDLRRLPLSVPLRGTKAQRDAYYGAEPTFTPARRYLQGSTWFNTDTNLNEVYMAVYDAATNPGGVQSPGTASWYSVGNAGETQILNSKFGDALNLPGNGGSAIVDRFDLKLDQGRFIRFSHFLHWTALGNAAGTLRASFKRLGESTSVPIQAGAVRVHSQGGPVKKLIIEQTYSMWVPAGDWVWDIYYNAEAGSEGSVKYDAYSRLTGGTR
jgi:hypothetical protein